MRIGNVIEAPGGGRWVVVNVMEHVVDAVSFDHENVRATQKLEDYTHTVDCSCTQEWTTEPDAACEWCHGEGRYLERHQGWKHAKVLAPTVQAFMLNGLKLIWGL